MLPGRLTSCGAVSPVSLKLTPIAISTSCIVPTSRYTIHADQPAGPTRIARLSPKSQVYWFPQPKGVSFQLTKEEKGKAEKKRKVVNLPAH